MKMIEWAAVSICTTAAQGPLKPAHWPKSVSAHWENGMPDSHSMHKFLLCGCCIQPTLILWKIRWGKRMFLSRFASWQSPLVSLSTLCYWQVSKTHNTQLLLQSCVHPKKWTTSCLCRQTLPHKYQDVEKEEKEGTERKGTCEMEVWQAELEESREDGWKRERVNWRCRWQQTKAAITTMMMVIWLSAWKSFCSFQPSDCKQQQQCRMRTRTAQQIEP